MSKTETTIPTLPATSASDSNPGKVVALKAAKAEQRPSEKVVAFVKSHPVLVVAGGLAAGALVSALLPRRMTRGVLSRGAHLAEAAGAATALLGKEAAEKAHDLSASARKKAGLVADSAEKNGELAAERLEKYGMAALAAASALGRASAKRASEAGEVAARQAHKISHSASETATSGGHRIAEIFSGLTQRLPH
ncbi:hypothetical protein EDF58_101825 [Novosphingobium sp. PhB57]|uniref:hypothetical protein n=1 Tax=Novosphingobium sp. PhB57 TaxID=2485107 RepID=UPI0010D4032E|nr:hypothetical protein [Novosphingobium sp. PhB57]TCU61503.1 hypothetical protein EDF58_101825 [Novosphingobium sp. PhB57]